MRYNLASTLPVRAFSPRGGRSPFNYGMTLEGGGGGDVISDVGGFVSDTVSSVGDVASSVVDSASSVIDSVGQGISDAAQNVSDAFAQIDPGPAIGQAGAAVDQVVNDVIPGGWATVGAVAATIATAGAASETIPEAVAAGEAAGAGVSAAAPIAETTVAAYDAGWSAAEAGVSAGTESAATNAAANSAVQAAATGAAKGAAIGAAKAAITGGDPLQGALNGAVIGAVGGGVGNYAGSLTQGTDLADYAKTVSSVAGGTAGGATGAAMSGRDPLTGALIGGLAGGTSNLASNIVPTDVNPAITSGVLGAIKAGVTGGDPLTGALSAAGSSLVGQGVSSGYDAIKGALPDNTTSTAQTTPPTADDYYKQFLTAFQNPQLSDQPAYAPLASNSDGSSVTVNSINDANGVSTPLVHQQPTVDQLKQYLQEDVAKGLITQSEADAELNKALGSSDTSASALDTLFYGDKAPKTLINAPSSATGNLPTATNTSGGGSGTTAGTGTGITGNVSAGGAGTGGTGTGGTGGTGTGVAGTGSGVGGSGGAGAGAGGVGIGTGLSYAAPTSQQLYNQSANAGLVNLTPGLTKTMDYNLSGLPTINETANPEHFATGGSANSSSLFDSQGNYNYGNTSETPLTPALTKHSVNYILAGLPALNKADGGLIAHMAGGGQFGSGGNYFGSSGNFGTNEKPEYPQEAEHKPQFYSEGGASLAHRYVTGDGDGTSDSIPAMLANGEFVIPADIVSNLGNGSNDSGAKILDEFLRVIREHKRKADAKHLPPDSKGPLSYLTDAKRKVRK
jgi:hypothetical protein